jgi:hypothetical protein
MGDAGGGDPALPRGPIRPFRGARTTSGGFSCRVSARRLSPASNWLSKPPNAHLVVQFAE